MTTFQIIMVSLGGLIGLSAFWENIKDGLKNIKDKIPKRPTVPVKPVVDHIDHLDSVKCDVKLIDVVRCWEHLRCLCEESNLQQASTELDKIFPLLVIEKEDKPDVI